MRVFVVVAEEPEPKLEDRLDGFNPIEIGPSAYLIVVNDDVLTSHVADKAGFREDPGTPGLVLEVTGAYSGWHQSDVWEWLQRRHSS